MRIVINFKSTGMANNGGTRTLVRCAEELSVIGHEVLLYSPSSNRYVWHKPSVKIVNGKEPPPCDVMLASGWGSWGHVLRSNARKKAVYVRGWELWNASDDNLLDVLRKFKNIYANSEWQVEHMRKAGLKQATLVYPGLDTHWFHELHPTEGDAGIHREGVGALMHNKNSKKRSVDAEAVERRLNIPFQYLNRHIKRPDSPTLNIWYNGLKVWLATPELEGLHNPPMEASLAGCAVVATDHPRSGMQDYLRHNQNALVYPARDIDKAAHYVGKLLDDEPLRLRLVNAMQATLRSVMGTRREAMEKFSDLLSKAK
jgi:hypothetical protein